MGFTEGKSTRYQGRLIEIQEWGYQISNGPGPRPWTRPAPYFRRTITSYPRASIFPTPTPASIAASPEAAINNLNGETQKSPQAMSYINIEPIEGYEESVNENTDEEKEDEEAWNKYATDEDDFELKKLRLKALLTGNLLEYKKAICQVYMKQAPEPEPVPIYLQQETLLKQANQMKAEKEQKEMDSIKGDEEDGQTEE